MRKQATRINILLIIALLALVAPRFFHAVHAQGTAEDEIEQVWQRVQQAGAYRFSADIVQTTSPQASVANAGRESKRNRLYAEGATDTRAETLDLTVWSQGGSVLDPDAAVEVQVEGRQARARMAGGDCRGQRRSSRNR